MAISGKVIRSEDGDSDVAPSGCDSSDSVVRSGKRKPGAVSAYDRRMLRAKAILDLQSKCSWSHADIVAALGWSRTTIWSSRVLVAATKASKDAE